MQDMSPAQDVSEEQWLVDALAAGSPPPAVSSAVPLGYQCYLEIPINLKDAETRKFVASAFHASAVPTGGTAITRILPPTSRFSAGREHGAKKQRVMEKLMKFFDRYFGLG